LATERGMHLCHDDQVRRELLQQLYSYGVIDKNVLAHRFEIDFDVYFASELERLQTLSDDGLVRLERNMIRLTPILGRLLVRVVAAVFDAYLPAEAYRVGMPTNLSSKVG